MYRLSAFLQKQPTTISAAVVAGLNLAMSFGFDLSGDQVGLINLFVIALLGLFVHQVSTPVSSPTLPSGTAVSVKGSEDKFVVPAPEGP
jgi:hypothetical protein